MPAAPTISHNLPQRNSFYGRRRASSSGSSSSSRNSHQRSESVGSSGSGSNQPSRASTSAATSCVPSSNTSAVSSKSSSSAAQRSSSPYSKKQAAVAAAANAASKRLQQVNAAAKSKSTSSERLRHDNAVAATALAQSWLDEPEYQTEVIEHMHRMETDTVACVDLMDAQPELRWYMRPYLVDFVVEIHQTFRLRPETLFLTMNIVDRYVSKRIVYKRHYQLVGCAALLIAAKFEDAKDKVPLVSELAQMCCSAYDESAFVQMEGHVLSTIGWILGYPTPEAWLRLACVTSGNQASSSSSKEVDILSTVTTPMLDARTLNMARFLQEVTLFTRDFIGILPSHLTAGCLLLARILASGDHGQDRETMTSNASPKAVEVAQLVDMYMIDHAHELSEILVKKYSFSHFGQASTAVVEWYAAFVERREAQRAVSGHSGMPTLLPAVSFSSSLNQQAIAATATTASSYTVGGAAMVKSTSASSFSTPRRSAEDMQDDEDDDEDEDTEGSISMRSRSTTPSSMISTPSQMSTDDGEDDEDDEDADQTLDDDEESDMPVTPLSLNSLHDPLVAAEAKENDAAGKNNGKNVTANAAVAVVKASSTHVHAVDHQHLQPRDDRRALSLSQQDNRLLV